MIEIRNTRPEDIPEIIELTRRVYPGMPAWGFGQLSSHLKIFPEGQFVALHSGQVVGMAASLILDWDDYDLKGNWRDFTDRGMFTNHDPHGRTLYGAEVMVDPSARRQGVGAKLYKARRDLARRLKLRRIRAGARLSGYHRYADKMTAAEYVEKVTRKQIRDPALSFQLRQGFRVLAVISDYLPYDSKSLGYAAVIEWLNDKGLSCPAETF